MKIEIPKQLIDVVKAGVKANREVPGSVALGGTVVALFTHHRESTDIDFVLSDLSNNFSEIREHLTEVHGWKERHVRQPFTIMGILDGIRIGYRQLRRSAPMDTQIIETDLGPLVVPTLEELLRTKAFLCYDRNYTRDFVDFAELSLLFETNEAVSILSDLDKRFKWEKQPTIMAEVIKSLLLAEPHDLDHPSHGFSHLRFMEPKLHSWNEVALRSQEIGELLAVKVTDET